MNPLCLFCILFLTVFAGKEAYTQGIQFEQGTWQEVVNKARSQQKLIFLHLESSQCQQCNEVADRAFWNPILQANINANFTSYRTHTNDAAIKELMDRYEIRDYTTSLFLDAQGSLLVRYVGSTTDGLRYIRLAEKALTESRKQPLTEMDKMYQQGERGINFMMQYISRRNELAISSHALLDELVDLLPGDSLLSDKMLLFIAEQGPVVNSKTYQFFWKDQSRIDSLFAGIGYQRTDKINNTIINRSIGKAIKDKDELLAKATAQFAMNTYRINRQRSQALYDYTMMRYYREDKDNTDRFISLMKAYCDKHYMSVDPNDVRQQDEIEKRKRLAQLSAAKETSRRIVISSSKAYNYGRQLSSAAWYFYQHASRQEDLEKALQWSARSLEFGRQADFMKTYAHLLYKLGQKKEAIKWQSKALGDVLSKGLPGSTFQEALRKMRKGTL